MKEADIQNSICDYLALKKHFFWRQNNTPTSEIRNGKRIFRKMPKYAIKGVPDIILIGEVGQFIGLEVKQKGKYLSKEQKEFKEKLEKSGGEYYLVRSIEDVQEIGL
jgi:hypothetical protein